MPLPDVIIKSTFDQSVQAKVVLDDKCIPVLWNKSFEKFFQSISGFVPASFSIPLFDWLEQYEQKNYSFYVTQLLTGSSKNCYIDLSIPLADRSRMWLELNISMLSIKETNGNDSQWLLCSFQDISEKKKHERQLVEAKEEAEKATQIKSNFLANMSHEIRTPIQTILGITELILDTSLDREQVDYINNVRFSADVLLGLVNDILDFSKVEAGKLELNCEDFDLREIMRQALDLVILEAHKKNLEVIFDVDENLPKMINNDSGRFRQVIVNLFKNAVKFTSKGQIELTAKLIDVGIEKSLYITVADSGPGISDELGKKLFTPFSQGSSGTITQGGTGLGLAISKSFVEAMGGKIWYEKNPTGGSIFGFKLPLKDIGNPPSRQTINSFAKILVIDDHQKALAHTMRVIKSFGLETDGVCSGQEALAVLRSAKKIGRPYNVCIIDQNMPGMDGWHFAAEVTSDKSINDVVMALLVPEGIIGPDTKMKLLQWVNAYAVKPIRTEELYTMLSRILSDDIDLQTIEETKLNDEKNKEVLKFVENNGSLHILKMSVLLAEDHPVNQEVFATILKRIGCEVYVANDGLEALELAETRNIDIVLMDIFMPNMGGYDASIALRKRGFTKPIIAITASAQKGEREKCLSVGMNDILVKPFKKNDLYLMLEKWKNFANAVKKIKDEKNVPLVEYIDEVAEKKEDGTILDIEDLVNTFLGNRKKVFELINIFMKKTESQIMELEMAIAMSDASNVRAIAHSIKGASWNLSMKSLGDSAAELEKISTNGELENIPLAVQNLVDRFDDLKIYLDSHYQKD